MPAHRRSAGLSSPGTGDGAGGARRGAGSAAAVLATIVVVVAACASAPPAPRSTVAVPTVAESLDRAGDSLPEAALLAVSVAVFDPGLGADDAASDAVPPSPIAVDPALRRAEARFLAYLLRDTLARSGQWGAVRVLPERDPTADLQLEATILRSDGQRLALAVTATDAAGERWIDGIYQAPPVVEHYASPGGEDPFQPLFDRIANDLVAARAQRPDGTLDRLQELATLRYAARLAPASFGAYLARDDQGRWRAVRLPARDDPTLARALRVRDTEYLFADTLDAHYGELYAAMARDYTLWRAYSREEIDGLARYRDQARQRRDDGSVRGMLRRYGDFRELKLQEEALREAASTLNRIIEPTIVTVEGTVLELGGSLEERYATWRELLERIRAEETGLPPADDPAP